VKRFLLFASLLGLDLLAKWAAIEWIPPIRSSDRLFPFGGIGIFDWLGVSFSLNYTTNTGAAWGLFPNYPGLLFSLRAAVIVGLVAYLLVSKGSKASKFPLWLVVTGAIGNVIDFCLYGHVIDFFHFVFWGRSFPIFNIADSCITLGVLALIFMRAPKQQLKAS
jgi:signal peptidase II